MDDNTDRRSMTSARWLTILLMVWLFLTPSAQAQPGNSPDVRFQGQPDRVAAPPVRQPAAPAPPQAPLGIDVDEMTSPRGVSSTLKILGLLTVLSLAPSILIMTTCFIRFVIVLGLLRQALGTQQLPPNQVIVSLCLFLTFLVMSPVWKQAYREGILPYTDQAQQNQAQPKMDLETAMKRTAAPLMAFMSDQIIAAGNEDAVWLFVEYQRPPENSPDAETWKEPTDFAEVTWTALVPAYILSELKTAFIIGFQIYLPFLIIDMVVSSVLISMGMMMLPPVLISIPFKLLLFVMIDGWFLTVGMMMDSVRPL